MACLNYQNKLEYHPGIGGPMYPLKKKTSLYIKANSFITDAPKVKYRGIFINDEAPAFSGWTKEKFGGVNHKVYEKIFELMLRLKGKLSLAGDVEQRI